MLANDDLGNLGRLGNQMFQYTALRGLLKDTHMNIVCLQEQLWQHGIPMWLVQISLCLSVLKFLMPQK
jgi:hypothetical protein